MFSTLLYNRMPQEQLKFALVVIRVMILCKLVWGRSRFPKHCQQDHVYFLFEIHVFLKFYFHSSLHNSLTFRSGNWGGQFIELIWFSLFPLHIEMYAPVHCLLRRYKMAGRPVPLHTWHLLTKDLCPVFPRVDVALYECVKEPTE